MLPPSSRLRASQQKPLESTPRNLRRQKPSNQDHTSGEFSLQSTFFFTSQPCTCSHPTPNSLISPQGEENPPQPGTGPAQIHPAPRVLFPRAWGPRAHLQPPPAPCPRYLPGLQPPSKGTCDRLRVPRPQSPSRLRAGRTRPRPFWVRAEDGT